MQKLNKVQEKGYIGPGTVKSKGLEDIHMVYDGTKCGLNSVIWTPWFSLPTIEEHLRAIVPGTYMADLDVGEQFLSFILTEDLQPYAGVDLLAYSDSSNRVWECWNCCFMGFTALPYCAAQGMLFAEELVRGDPDSISNVSRYSPVNLNLPGTVDYRPYLPWVFKTHSEGMLACDLFIYVDDSRTTGPTEEECWAASRQYGYTITYLGLQDAARKHREPSTDPGPWAGSIVKAKDDVYVLISQERWDKVKGMLQWLWLSLDYGLPIDQKTLESVTWCTSAKLTPTSPLF
jgi:hypothetical protein